MSRFLTALSCTLLACPALAQEEDDREIERQARREATERVRAFQTHVRTLREETEIVRAIEDLGQVQHEVVRTELARWLVGHPGDDVRIAAARELGRYEEDAEAATAILGALQRQRSKDVLVAFVQQVGKIGARDARITRDLSRHFEHTEVEVAQAAIEAAGDIRAVEFIDPLIALVMKLEQFPDDAASTAGGGSTGGIPGGTDPPQAAELEQQVLRKQKCLPTALASLKAITREDFAGSREWNDWWRQNRRTFRLPEDD